MTTYFEEIGSILCVTSGFRSEKAENWRLKCCYAPSSGNLFLTFRDNTSVQSSWVQEFVWIRAPLRWDLQVVPKHR